MRIILIIFLLASIGMADSWTLQPSATSTTTHDVGWDHPDEALVFDSSYTFVNTSPDTLKLDRYGWEVDSAVIDSIVVGVRGYAPTKNLNLKVGLCKTNDFVPYTGFSEIIQNTTNDLTTVKFTTATTGADLSNTYFGVVIRDKDSLSFQYIDYVYMVVYGTEVKVMATPLAPMVTTWQSETNSTPEFGFLSAQMDSEDVVTYRPYFSCSTRSSYATDCSLFVCTFDNTDTLCYVNIAYDDSPTQNERKKIRYPTNAGGGDYLQDGVKYKAKMKQVNADDDSVSAWTDSLVFYGVKPIEVWSADYGGSRNIRMGKDHDSLWVGYQVHVPIPTGYGVLVDTFGFLNDAVYGVGNQVGQLGNWVYEVHMNKTSDHSTQNRIVQMYLGAGFEDSTHYVYTMPLVSAPDAHYYPVFVFGADNKLHVWRSGHHTPLMYVVSTNAHTDSTGIDIESWDAVDILTQFPYTTYPRPVVSDSGHIYVFFRHSTSSSGNNPYRYCYITRKWNGSSYGDWTDTADVRCVVNFWDYGDTEDSPPSIYSAGVEIHNDTCWLEISWHHNYGNSDQETIGNSVLFSPMEYDNTNGYEDEFYAWYELCDTALDEDGYRLVGYTADSVIQTDSSTTIARWGSSVKAVICGDPIDTVNSTPVGPFPHQNMETILIDDNNVPCYVYMEDACFACKESESDPHFMRWNTKYYTWMNQSLGGDTRIRFRDSTSTTACTLTYRTDSLMIYNDSYAETLTGWSTPYEMWETINFSSDSFWCDWVGAGLPDDTSGVEFVGNDVNDSITFNNTTYSNNTLYQHAEITAAGWPRAWYVLSGGQVIKDGHDIYVYLLVRPDEENEQYGGELVRLHGDNFDGEGLPHWSWLYLSSNTAGGIGRLSTLKYTSDTGHRVLAFGRLEDVILNIGKFFQFLRPDGKDLTIVEGTRVADTMQWREMHRLPDNNFQLNPTSIRYALGKAIPADLDAPVNTVYLMHWSNPDKDSALASTDSIDIINESFEEFESRDVLNRQWLGGTDIDGYTDTMCISDSLQGYQYVVPLDFVLDSVGIYNCILGPGQATYDTKVAIYEKISADSCIKLAVSGAITIDSSKHTFSWEKGVLSAPCTLSAGDTIYCVVWADGNPAFNAEVKTKTLNSGGTVTLRQKYSNYTGTFPDTLVWAGTDTEREIALRFMGRYANDWQHTYSTDSSNFVVISTSDFYYYNQTAVNKVWAGENYAMLNKGYTSGETEIIRGLGGNKDDVVLFYRSINLTMKPWYIELKENSSGDWFRLGYPEIHTFDMAEVAVYQTPDMVYCDSGTITDVLDTLRGGVVTSVPAGNELKSFRSYGIDFIPTVSEGDYCQFITGQNAGYTREINAIVSDSQLQFFSTEDHSFPDTISVGDHFRIFDKDKYQLWDSTASWSNNDYDSTDNVQAKVFITDGVDSGSIGNVKKAVANGDSVYLLTTLPVFDWENVVLGDGYALIKWQYADSAILQTPNLYLEYEIFVSAANGISAYVYDVPVVTNLDIINSVDTIKIYAENQYIFDALQMEYRVPNQPEEYILDAGTILGDYKIPRFYIIGGSR